MSQPTASDGASRLSTICVLVLLVAAFGVAINHGVQVSRLNADEGFYLGAPLATLKGELPYRDYAYTQGPLLPMINAPLLAMFPPTLATVRWISAGWNILGIGAAFLLLQGWRRPVQAAGWLLLLLASPLAMSFLSIGKTYSLAQFLVLVASSGLVLPVSWRKRLLWLSFFGVLTVGTRLTLAPVIGLLWLGLWWLHRREAKAGWMLGAPLGFTAILLGPFIVPDPERFVYWNLQYYLEFQKAVTGGLHPDGFWRAEFLFCPGIWTGVLLAVVLSGRAWKKDPAAVFLLGAATIGLLFNLLRVGVYAEYATPFVLLLLVGAGRVVLAAEPPRWLAPAACGVLAVASVFLAQRPELHPTQQKTPLLAQAREAARFLEEQTKPGDEVLACNAEIPLAAHRPLFRNLIMGKFAVTTEYSATRAARLGLVHYQEILDATDGGKMPAIAMTWFNTWNFAWTAPSLRLTPEYYTRLGQNISRYYALAYYNDIYLVVLPKDHPYFLTHPPIPTG